MKKYLLWLIPMLVLLILATAFYPAYNPEPREISIAILNEDNGVEIQGKKTNVGNTLVDKMKENGNDTFAWKEVTNREALDKGLEDNKYVGALVLEKDFSKNAMSQAQSIIMTEKQKEVKAQIQSGALSPEQQALLSKGAPTIPNPQKAKMEVIVNQGSNGQIATIAQQALGKITDQISNQISEQNAKALVQNNVDLPSDQYEMFANPVTVDQTTLHEIKDHQANGNAGASMFMPVWLTSLITGVISFTLFKNRGALVSHKDKLIYVTQTVCGIILSALIGSFAYIHYMDYVLGFDFNQATETAMYIAIAIMGFSLLIFGCMAWIGFGAVPILMLFVFFSIQASVLPSQMLPEFYQNYILPWNPFYHYVSTLKELLYDGVALTMNGTMWMFVVFIIFGIVSFVTAVYTKKVKEQPAEAAK
ncbi:hypothetical protein TP70_02115 [Staphylococcus microti]|uniref:Phage infection protein n=1 Tax=Staphylococcus microti TaxID=569857 RepID=A0A0D6XUG7_9STAP|nr:ABC transporter permease [Staphylococcus microti]KIX91488.1 hypothetical protein TP70_02115 [Staphylococcus microti]PNZ77538.1 phage infection protein [Staphylococcus microti]SUM56434.1 phage infection protein [Staphylococcus microti]